MLQRILVPRNGFVLADSEWRGLLSLRVIATLLVSAASCALVLRCGAFRFVRSLDSQQGCRWQIVPMAHMPR